MPTNINKLSSAVFCFDNNDLCEETRTGGNTTQCTNGIVIQRMSKSNTSQHEDSSDHGKAQRRPLNRQSKNRPKRSLQITCPSEPAPYNAGQRCGPGTYNLSIECLSGSSNLAEPAKKAMAYDFAWLLARLNTHHSSDLGSSKKETIPGWSGFNSNVRPIPPVQSAIFLLASDKLTTNSAGGCQ